MRLRQARLINFKRFADLTVEVPTSARLVLLVGPNGSGKSSFLDGLHLWHQTRSTTRALTFDQLYYGRGATVADWSSFVTLDFDPEIAAGSDEAQRALYLRSAYRNEPDVTSSGITRGGDTLTTGPLVSRMIENDVKVSDNYRRLVAQTISDVYGEQRDDETVRDLREAQLRAINNALRTLFPALTLDGLGDPLSEGSFFFTKGDVRHFHYKNLSAGEKGAFDLVLDLLVKVPAYGEAVYCIDEPEAHLNAAVHGRLVDVLLSVIPSEGQLWISTHSAGMMRRALELARDAPETVAFLDFGDRDFDEAQTIAPARTTRDFWKKHVAVALGDLAALVAPRQLILCEGRPADPTNPARAEFDARCLRRIFGDTYPEAEFASVGNSGDVVGDRLQLGRAAAAISDGTEVIRVIDRDLRTPEEVTDLQNQGVRVLTRRHIESYLLDDEIVELLAGAVGMDPGVAQEIKATAMRESVARGNDPDDVKSAAGRFYADLRRTSDCVGLGSTTEAFLADTVAPLVSPATATFRELRADIFGDVP